MFRTKTRIYEKNTLKITFISMNKGSGTTHFSLSSANYYRNKMGLKVLFADCSNVDEGDSGILGLRTEDIITIRDMSGFIFNRIDFLCGCKVSDVLSIDEKDYDVIITMINDKSDDMAEVFRFDEVFLCGSAKPWNYRRLQESYRRILNIPNRTRGKNVFFGLTKKEYTLLKDEFGITATNMPFISDPFYLSKEDVRALRCILPDIYV